MKEKMFLGIAALFLIFSACNVSADFTVDYTNRTCIDDTHLFVEKSWNEYNGSAWESHTVNQTIYCNYNCSDITLSCNPHAKDVDPFFISIILSIVITLTMVFLLLSYMFREAHKELTFLFLVMPLWFLVAAVYISGMGITAATQEPLQNLIFTLMLVVEMTAIFTIFILLMKFVFNTLKRLTGGKKYGEL